MTGAIHDGIRTGRFMDPVWTEMSTARFATTHFDAEQARDAHDPTCPRAGRAAFTAAAAPRISAVEPALLGINAHIVDDLAVARDDAEREAVRQHLDRVACGYGQRIDVTQLLPGGRVRAMVSRWRPPLTSVCTPEG